jgi:hypothetical protein
MGIVAATGKVIALRAHDLGTGYGPSTDYIDVEVVVRLDSMPNDRFGFQLRQDTKLPSREGMFQLLLSAMQNNWNVTMDYDSVPGKMNHILFRVWVGK